MVTLTVNIPLAQVQGTLMRLWHWRRIRPPRSAAVKYLITILLILALIKIYFDFFPGYIVDTRTENALTNLDNKRVEVEKACSKTTKMCYSVVDLLSEESNTAHRVIYLHGFEREYDSIATLITPIGMTTRNSDTRMWRVDHSTINSQYVAWLILAPFVVGALSTAPLIDKANAAKANASPQSILVVGLGGGTVDMFIHEQYPDSINITVMELDELIGQMAHDWFGVRNDSTRRTLIKDGVEGIKDARLAGDRYDVVVIDACDSSKAIPCPAPGFITLSTLKRISGILKPMGALIMNVLPMVDEDNNIKMVQRRLLSVFPVCMWMRMIEEMNTVVACLPYNLMPENVEQTKQIWMERQQRMVEHFKFKDLLKHFEELHVERAM